MDGQDKKTADTGLTIVPGGIHRWQTVIPPGIRRDLPARLEFVFLSARPDAPEEINTLWLMGPSDRPDSLRFRVGARHGQTHHIDLPADFLEPGRAYAIACANIHDAMPTAVAFSGNGGPQLLIPARNFAANMARAGLMILARLAFLTALGLTAGAAFSFPVAVFLAGAIPMFDRLNCFRDTVGRHWVRWAFGTDDGRWPARLLDYAVAGISQAVRLLTPTLERFNPSSMIAAARLIPWRAAGQTIGVFLLYTILLAGAGAWLIMRRQAGADKS